MTKACSAQYVGSAEDEKPYPKWKEPSFFLLWHIYIAFIFSSLKFMKYILRI